MKKFLITCIIAMISAGIYGFIDMTRDIHNGTMIDYEHQQTPQAKQYSRSLHQTQTNNSIQKKIMVNEETKKKEEKKNETKVVDTDLNMSYFSRGDVAYQLPIEDLSADTQSVSLSAKSDTTKISTPEQKESSDKKKEKTDSASTTAITTQLPKLDIRMFSRGGFNSYKKPTVAIVDSTLKK